MKTINLIKSKPNIIDWIFILSGGHFYMNWILPTNQQSKNKLIKRLWGGKGWYNAHDRYKYVFIYSAIHLPFAIMNAIGGYFWHPLNILINLYPLLVQLYIGHRCWKIIQHKKSMLLISFLTK